MERRKFIQLSSAIAGGVLLPAACRQTSLVKGEMKGASAQLGHMFRDMSFTLPDITEEAEIVIVGGGISALSAARWLKRNGKTNVVLLELEQQTGGNAASGKNEVSAFSWGAHYVPVANNDLAEYKKFLEEAGVITGYSREGLPVYNEFYLCSDPQERLYINGAWQDGLVPHSGLAPLDNMEIEQFLAQMQHFRQATGSDGRPAFTIPLDLSSKDATYTVLDTITMKYWLQQQQYKSEYLYWYINYCTRDDFGTPIEQISAWAAIHYFASRKGKAANAQSHDVVTWPEGNAWLARQLANGCESFIRTGAVVVKIIPDSGSHTIGYYDVSQKKLRAIRATQCIMAVPQFVVNRLLPVKEQRVTLVKQHFSYVPWIVANLTVESLAERSGVPLSWDNVSYDSQSLGYVNACQQQLQQIQQQKVLTWYYPLTGQSPSEERKIAQQRSHEQWVNLILDDLAVIHPDIRKQVKQVDIMIWGHAMLQPLPGIIHGPERNSLKNSPFPGIHLAHTDLAGTSIFEEAFYQGIKAAEAVMKSEIN